MIPLLLLALQSADPSTAAPGPTTTAVSVTRVGDEREAPYSPDARLPLFPRLWALEWGIRAPGLVRFNRVEGLSVGARYRTRFGATDLRITGRLGYGDLTPGAEVEVTRENPTRTLTAAVYSGVTAVDRDGAAVEFTNSVNALFLGRDDGEYFRASGLSLRLGPPGTARPRWDVTLYGEAQRAVVRGTTESLASLLGGRSLRPVMRATAAEQVGALVRLRPWWGTDPSRAQGGFDLAVRGETGSHSLVRTSLGVTVALQVSSTVRMAGTIHGAVLRGDRLPQRLWYLGGPSSLRGYRGSTLGGSDMVRGRLELARSFNFGSIVVFGDGGWAGETAPRLDEALFSAGAGLSVLDGVVRVDLARALRATTGWSVELYLDAIL